METKDKNSVCVIVNPVSGVKHMGVEAYSKLVEGALDKNRFSPKFHTTEYRGHGADIAKAELSAGTRYFLIAGGDGTVNEVASELIGKEAIMGIIPFGSGNGLAHHLNIPVKTTDAISAFNQGRVLKIDTCSVNEKSFVSIAGIGFDARVAKQFARSNRRGFFTYARIVFKEYFTYSSRKYRLLIDGKEIITKAFFISFANSSQFGYNTRIAPNASITDGMIDICIVRKPPLRSLPWIFHLLLRHKVDRSKYMEVIQASAVSVERNKGRTVNVDGEPIRMKQALNIKLRPASLSVVVPQK